MRGEIATEASRTKPPFWVKSIGGRELILSSFHIGPLTARHYADVLREFGAVCLEAYPSSAYALAQFMEEMGIEPLGLKAVITSSETLLSHQRQLIERMLGQLFDYYGTAERVAFISTCEQGNYHYLMDYSIIEFLRTDQEGARQIVGTSLGNRFMPLYRYATGDTVRLSGASCACGRAFPVVDEIDGRLEDVVRAPSGRVVGRLGSVFKDTLGVRESQIIQDRLDHLLVLVAAGPGYGRVAESQIRSNLNDRLGGEMSIDIEIVDKIPRSASGKLRFLVSKI
jgi:phenylacetate-CoA ligase